MWCQDSGAARISGLYECGPWGHSPHTWVGARQQDHSNNRNIWMFLYYSQHRSLSSRSIS